MNDSVAIVTGASQGIGRATAIRLAKDFSKIVLVARNGANLRETAKEVQRTGTVTLTLDLDLSLSSSPDIVVSNALDKFGRIDALLNIAGAVPQVDILEMSDEQWIAGAELKLHGARRLTIRAWEAKEVARVGGPHVRKFGPLS